MSHLSQIEMTFWVSLIAAPLGCLLLFRRLSFFGDALGHAGLAGVAVVLLSGSQSPILFSVGALIAVLLTSQLMRLFEKAWNFPSDVALTSSYAGIFALGLLILNHQKFDHEHLEHLLFGDLSEVSSSMLWFLRIWGPISLALLILYWKPLWSVVMDSSFARSLGVSLGHMDRLLLLLASVSVVGLIQTVGAVLVPAYLVFPAATALAFSRSLKSMVLFSFGAAIASSSLGLFASVRLNQEAGPAIAFSGFVLLILAHLFARFWKSAD